MQLELRLLLPTEMVERTHSEGATVFDNSFRKPVEILSEEAVAILEKGWLRLMHEYGIQFKYEPALAAFREAGLDIDEDVVHFPEEFVREKIALAPREFELVARNPSKTSRVGGTHMAFCSVQGPPFVREGSERRAARLDDHVALCKLAHTFDQLDVAGGIICEPQEISRHSGHLDLQYNSIIYMDKPYMGSQVSLTAAKDTVAMAAIVAGGIDALRTAPRFFSSTNPVSPLMWDDRMSSAIMEFAAAGQAIALSPFIMMGAVSPTPLASAIAQDIAEALAGICLAQTVHPGTPVMLGGFLTNIDMWSGQPGFGGPESGNALLAFGQIARHLGLPWRAGGGFLTSSPLPDAQAGYDSMNTMLHTFMAGANFILHSAGWMESALAACFEKFVIDIEMLQVIQAEFSPVEISEELLAYDDHVAAGHSGTFLATPWTMAHFRDAFYRPMVSTVENIQAFVAGGEKDTAQRATEIWKRRLEEYEQPPLDDAVKAELDEYVAKRREVIEKQAEDEDD